jgi:cytochrome c peroxidase
LQKQVEEVLENPDEMAATKEQVLQYLLSCKQYKDELNAMGKLTPNYPKVSFQHISSALTYYYTTGDTASAPFDAYMNLVQTEPVTVREGFNLFMGKAQCATCHFVPIFNGVKPPYTNSEFEVLGTPADTMYNHLSVDSGRFTFHRVPQMWRAFKTPTLRNSSKTAPYMHNGVFGNLQQVMAFYNTGGGKGNGLQLDNQTLSAEPLGLTQAEIEKVIAFINALNENLPNFDAPNQLPISSIKALNKRKIGGEY